MNQTQQVPQGLDPTAFILTKAIKGAETQGHPDPYNAKGDNGNAIGAYQIQKQYWSGWAKQYLGDANAAPTEENQNKLAYMRVKSLLDQGHSQTEVASIWNSGRADPNAAGAGYNPAVKANFDVPAYVNKVKNNYVALQQQFGTQTPSADMSQGNSLIPTANASTGEPAPASEPTVVKEKTPGVLGVISRFLGIDALGQGIGKALFQFTPEYKQLEDMLNKGQISPEDFIQITTGGLTNRDVLASAANTALTIGTAGLGSGEAAVAKGATGTLVKGAAARAIPAATGLGRIAAVAKTGAQIGAASGAIGAYGEGDGIGGIAKGAATSGLIGGALGGVGGAISEGFTSLFNKFPEHLVNQSFKDTLGNVKKGIKTGEDTFSKQVLDHGVIGTNKQVYTNAISKVAENETALQNILKTTEGTITKDEIKPFFSDLITKYNGTPGMGADVKIVRTVLKELPLNMTLDEANIIKRNLYSELGNPAYRLDASLSTKREAMKTLARGLKDMIEQKTGKGTLSNSVVNHFNRELAFWGKLRDKALTNVAKGSHFGLKDMSALGLGELAFGHPGALTLEAGRKAYATTIGKTAVAQGLNSVNKVLESPAGKAVSSGVNLTGRLINKNATQ